MRVNVIGGGPAGLYFSYLLKRRRPDAEIRLFEQNPPDATFGFGVVFSDRALEFLRADDPETHDLITPAMEKWDDITVNHRGETVRIDGVGFTAIGRLELIRLLQQRARTVGIEPVYEYRVDRLDTVDDADLLVGADGVNSLVREEYAKDFGATVDYLTNKFVWYGATKPFDTLTQTFVETADGRFNAHHYRYTPEMSTFIVETDAETWTRAGFAEMDDPATRAYCEAAFADVLDGHSLVSNKSVWRNFPKVWNERWHAGNKVLLGDALHTAHFSIGSGTRLALEDAIALDRALGAHAGDIPAALRLYEAERRPVVETLVAAANRSAQWYENFARHMELDPWEFAWSYITRSGRVDIERLRRSAPGFVAAYEAAKGRG